MSKPASLDMADLANRQLLGLTTLVQLMKRARHAGTAQEFAFLAVNDTHTLVRYRQAALWRREDGRIEALSGLAAPDPDAPFVRWLRRSIPIIAEERRPTPLTRALLPAELAEEWAEFLPAHALWVPLDAPGGSRPGGLLLAREEPFGEGERLLLETIADGYGHAWAALASRRPGPALTLHRLKDRKLLIGAGVALFLLAWMPVRQSALAPAEVVARDPTVIRAPFEGVVEGFEVKPNEPVVEGQVLFRLDPVRLNNRLEVARSALQVAEAELRQANQLAVFDEKAKTQLPVLQGRRDQHAAEVAYVEDLLRRIEVRSPRAGTAIFADVNDWIGRPVAVGERVLMVADPRDTELEVRLPVADAIALEPGGAVRLFLNIDPQNPVDATLRIAGYQPEVQPDGVAAYRLKAAFAEGTEPIRVGLKGTAKVYGERTTLFYYLFRRPLAALRQWAGL